MVQRTRNLMTMNKALYPRDDVNRLCVSRKEWERGIASIEYSVDASIQRLEDYIKKTDYSHQKQYWQHKDKQNGEKKRKTKMRRKATLWTF